jgi:very-short-patch-repair endonuclease
MKKNKIIPYNPKLKLLARELRNNSTKSEIILWNKIKNRSLGVEFHRQVPIDEYIVDFFCHELMLAIEIDGSTHYYNFEKDDIRQKRLESFGIKVFRIEDKDVRFALNDVLRAVELIVEELVINNEEHPPRPPSKGE